MPPGQSRAVIPDPLAAREDVAKGGAESRPKLASLTSGLQDAAEPVADGRADALLSGAGVCVVIPAFNEGRSVAGVVDRVKAALPAAGIVVVNDGSHDDTGSRAARAGAAVVNLPLNLGIGGAVQTGFRYAMRQGYLVAVQVDGDGQHDPSEIPRLLEPISQGRSDIVVGSRWLGRGDYVAPSARRSGMRILARMVSWRTGSRFTDTTSGFRAVSGPALQLFAENYPTDFPEVESLVLATQHRCRVIEVPVWMTKRAHGSSSISGSRSAYYMLRVGLGLLIGRLSPPNDEKEELDR